MMTTPRLLPRLAVGALLVLATTSSVRAQTPAAQDNQQLRVQITEIGCLRTLLLLDENTLDLEDLISQQLTDKDFRVFPDAQSPAGKVTPEQMRAAGEKANADLIVYARTTDRLKNQSGDWLLYEAEATVQIYSRVSGELLVTKLVTADGKRTTDKVNAPRTARRAAITEATQQAIERSLAKAHKILVHEAVIVNVFSDSALLALMEYIGRMEGVYHVRRLDFDRKTNEAHIEIIGTPRSETFWRAYLEKMPKTKVNVQVTANDTIHNKYPSWFQQPAQN